MSFTATARPIAGGLRHLVDVNGRHTIATDEPAGLGGTDTAPTPHELLAAALASCASTMVALYARRHAWPTDGLSVEVRYHADEVPRRFEVDVRLPAGLDDEQVKRLERVARTCPVRRALEDDAVFVEQLLAPTPS